MTENMTKFLELVSDEGEEYTEKLTKVTKEEFIAMAAEKGITLTDADFEVKTEEGEVSIEEAEAVAGGKKCYCVVGGHGGYTKYYESRETDDVCACVTYGQGDGLNRDYGGPGERVTRCRCVATGEGASVT